jgi:hypothetical protein
MRVPKPSLARAGLLAAVVFAATGIVTYGLIRLVGDGGGELAQPASAGQLRWTVNDAENFDDFSLYWLGESYEGLPLTAIIRYTYVPEPPTPALTAEDSVTFIYGDCTPVGEEGSCVPPVSITLEPYCMKPPEIYPQALRLGEPFEVRGATAERITGHLRVWAEDAAMTIFSDGSKPDIQVAEDLTAVNDVAVAAGTPLGPVDVSC